MNNYDDIINLMHHVSSKRPRMSLENRAAQFAPFSALSGYEEAINETSRIVDKKIEISETSKIILDNKIKILIDNLKNKPEIIITYFEKDEKKDGGKYIKTIGNIEKIDIYKQLLVLEDKTIIPLIDIYDIDGNIFLDIIE